MIVVGVGCFNPLVIGLVGGVVFWFVERLGLIQAVVIVVDLGRFGRCRRLAVVGAVAVFALRRLRPLIRLSLLVFTVVEASCLVDGSCRWFS